MPQGRGEHRFRGGGARVGWWRATYPLATLSVTRDEIALEVALIGTYVFRPKDIVKIERWGVIPLIGSGVRFRHAVGRYPERMVFLYWFPRLVIDRIQSVGFQPSAPSEI